MTMDKTNVRLPRSAPEAEGVSSRGLISFLDMVERSGIEFHLLTVARHGKVILQGEWAPYRQEFPHMTHSLTKLFTNTAVGMACTEGYFSLDSHVISFFPDEAPATISDNLAAMTVRDLITMRCGHGQLLSGNKWRPIKTSWVAEFFKEPLPYAPGDYFQYTSATSYMLSAIVQKTTGLTAHAFLREKLFDPMGIEDESWDLCPHGINTGGNGLTIKNEDCVKIGLLYLNDGELNGKRYLSREWVREAMYDACTLNPDTGYGFHLSNEGRFISSGGIFGQTVVLVPEYDMVVAINAANQTNRSNALDSAMRPLLEEGLLAAIQDETSAAEPEAVREVESRLKALSLRTPEGAPHSPGESAYSGEYAVPAPVDSIASLHFAFDAEGCTFRMKDDRGEHSVRCGNHAWAYGQSSMTGYYLHHQYQPDSTRVAGRGWWVSPTVYVMQWAWVNMTFVDTVVCEFSDGGVAVKRRVNVNTITKPAKDSAKILEAGAEDKERPEIRGMKTKH